MHAAPVRERSLCGVIGDFDGAAHTLTIGTTLHTVGTCSALITLRTIHNTQYDPVTVFCIQPGDKKKGR